VTAGCPGLDAVQERDKITPLACNLLLAALTIGAGAVDATTLLLVGHVFSSVITGNLVLLGVAAGRHVLADAASAAVAVAGYAVGVAIGVRVAAARRLATEHTSSRDEGGQDEGGWPLTVTVALAIELAVVICFSVAWELAGATAAHWRLAALALLAAAMGLQSAAVRQLGQVSTTYLTSTLTGVVADLVNRATSATTARSVLLIAAVAAGAVAGTVTARMAPTLVPVVLASPVAAAVTAVVVIHVANRNGRSEPADPPNAG
jgi:uncharacterized membrane protein YoaK (UPF0700 family)